MKVSYKVLIVSSLVLLLTIGSLSWLQYSQAKSSVRRHAQAAINEESIALAQLVTNWLSGKLQLIDLLAQEIDTDFTPENINNVFSSKILKDQFLLIFGGLDTDGKAITNDPTWNPVGWDARKRPWYNVAKNGSHAMLTEPYEDATTKDILISVVANFSDKGQFKGAFGGDLSLKTVSESLNTLSFNNSGYAFLVSKDGNIISHPKSQYNGQKYSVLFAGKNIAFDKQIQEINVDGNNLWINFTKLQDLGGAEWYIGIVVNADIILVDVKKMGWYAVIAAIISVLVGIVVLGALMQVILRPVGLLNQSLIEINSGQGDLTKRLPVITNDEFGELARQFNRFIENLQNIISSVKELALQVDKSTVEVSSKSERAASELNQQLSELDQLATAMNQMASSAVEVAGNAQVAAQEANTAEQEANNGVKVVSASTNAINRLAEQMGQAVASVVELSKVSNDIESILLVITSIAEQTNLLALNAAIEAARAGESGRGFAVVADEVRSLASRTQESTRQIRTMIEQLQNGVRLAESSIKESREGAIETSLGAQKANTALQIISASIVKISDMNIQIAAAAEQQSATTEEINRNTTKIRDISQDVANGAQEQVQQASIMRSQVAEQDRTLNQFKV